MGSAGGLYTNYANTSSEVGTFDLVDLHGLTSSVARFARNSSISLGIGYSKGRGKGQVFSADIAPQDLDSSKMAVFLSSSYSF